MVRGAQPRHVLADGTGAVEAGADEAGAVEARRQAEEPRATPATFGCGHPRTEANTYWSKQSGGTYAKCRECMLERNKAAPEASA